MAVVGPERARWRPKRDSSRPPVPESLLSLCAVDVERKILIVDFFVSAVGAKVLNCLTRGIAELVIALSQGDSGTLTQTFHVVQHRADKFEGRPSNRVAVLIEQTFRIVERLSIN